MVVVDLYFVINLMGIDIATFSQSEGEPKSKLIINSKSVLPIELLFNFNISLLKSWYPDIEGKMLIMSKLAGECSCSEGVEACPVFRTN